MDDGHISNDAAQATQANGEALSVSAIETYARCPRQYAYRYVEELGASDGNLPRMRRGILEALRLLHGSDDVQTPMALMAPMRRQLWHTRSAASTTCGSRLLHPHRRMLRLLTTMRANGHLAMRIAAMGAALSSAHGMRSRAAVIATSVAWLLPNRWNLKRRWRSR